MGLTGSAEGPLESRSHAPGRPRKGASKGGSDIGSDEAITDKMLGAVEEVREGRADSKGRTAVRISITSSLTASSGVRVQLASGSFFAVCRFGLVLNRFWR